MSLHLPGTLKLTARLHLKFDAWNTIVSFWDFAYFQGLLLLVLGSVFVSFPIKGRCSNDSNGQIRSRVPHTGPWAPKASE